MTHQQDRNASGWLGAVVVVAAVVGFYVWRSHDRAEDQERDREVAEYSEVFDEPEQPDDIPTTFAAMLEIVVDTTEWQRFCDVLNEFEIDFDEDEALKDFSVEQFEVGWGEPLTDDEADLLWFAMETEC